MPRTAASLTRLLTGRPAHGPDPGRPWKVWDLDGELRYLPVVRALPESWLPVCEVGSGSRGLAAWTDRPVIGIDPGDDERHGDGRPPPNLRRVVGDGASIPLEDGVACATVAVDTLEHVPPEHRRAVIAEMLRVTAPGGVVILMGPVGDAAADGDRRVRERWLAQGPHSPLIGWLDEHIANGLPTLEELVSHLQDERVAAVHARGVFNIRLWWTMHRALMGDFRTPRAVDRVHHLLWAPFAVLARRLRRGPFYRHMVVAEVRGDDAGAAGRPPAAAGVEASAPAGADPAGDPGVGRT